MKNIDQISEKFVHIPQKYKYHQKKLEKTLNLRDVFR